MEVLEPHECSCAEVILDHGRGGSGTAPLQPKERLNRPPRRDSLPGQAKEGHGAPVYQS
jgi:hypothetical protein